MYEVFLNWKFWSILLPVIGVIIVGILRTTSILSKSARDVKDELGEKINTETEMIRTEINHLYEDNKKSHKIMIKNIIENTEITKKYSSFRDALSILNSIKSEACRWAPKELSQFLIMKADSMKKFFMNILERKFSKINIELLKNEMEIEIGKLKLEGEGVIDKKFIDYYFNEKHSQNITNYLQDLTRYKNGGMNNMNEAFLSCSVVFYRHSLEDLLDIFNKWKEKK